ncbi:hypothetical protein SUGI_0912280 [Cryptomeria japonica]|nr:hypothetical protein SUGI_0912280 [Cryptomeria japonica]
MVRREPLQQRPWWGRNLQQFSQSELGFGKKQNNGVAVIGAGFKSESQNVGVAMGVNRIPIGIRRAVTHQDWIKPITNGPWGRFRCSFSRFKWNHSFNPRKHRHVKKQLWISLIGLPSEFWHLDALIRIGDALGASLGVEEEFLNDLTGDIANLLVEVDANMGIYQNIEIISELGKWIQRIEILQDGIIGKYLLRENMKEGCSTQIIVVEKSNSVGENEKKKEVLVENIRSMNTGAESSYQQAKLGDKNTIRISNPDSRLNDSPKDQHNMESISSTFEPRVGGGNRSNIENRA